MCEVTVEETRDLYVIRVHLWRVLVHLVNRVACLMHSSKLN